MEVGLLGLTNIIRHEHQKRNVVDQNQEVRQGQEVDREVHLVREVDREVPQEVDHEVDPAPDPEVVHELAVEHQKTRKREEEVKKDQEAQKKRNLKSVPNHDREVAPVEKTRRESENEKITKNVENEIFECFLSR